MAATLATDLSVSATARTPNMFFRPEIGLSFLGSGATALNDGLNPTWPTDTTRPASAHTSTSGAAASIT